MHPRDRRDYVQRYEDRLREHGYSHKTLGWGQEGREDLRFGALTQPLLRQTSASVLDVGCGFADLFDYLRNHGWRGSYIGIDLVSSLLDVARERHPDLDLRVADISDPNEEIHPADFVIASGVFNARLHENDNLVHIETSLRRMFQLSKVAVCVDFMSTLVDYRHEDAWHTDPSWAATVAGSLSNRFLLKHDYMPYEFAVIIYSDDSSTEQNLFATYDARPTD